LRRDHQEHDGDKARERRARDQYGEPARAITLRLRALGQGFAEQQQRRQRGGGRKRG
jgi:hypothetical protein